MEKDEKNDKNQNLFEDLVQYSNQYTQGAHPSGRNGDNKLTLIDLLRANSDGDDKAPKIMPYQMNTFDQSLGDLYVQVVEIQKMIAAAYKSSNAKDLDKLRKGLIEINKNLQNQKKLIKDCSKIVDNM